MPLSPTIEETTTEEPIQVGGPWRVILWDDNEHTYEYVIEMLMDVCKMTPEQAFGHAVEVDAQKKTVVFAGELEHAENIQDRILNYGPDPLLPASKGSMSATLEGD